MDCSNHKQRVYEQAVSRSFRYGGKIGNGDPLFPRIFFNLLCKVVRTRGMTYFYMYGIVRKMYIFCGNLQLGKNTISTVKLINSLY